VSPARKPRMRYDYDVIENFTMDNSNNTDNKYNIIWLVIILIIIIGIVYCFKF
jgi:hypothetical protein